MDKNMFILFTHAPGLYTKTCMKVFKYITSQVRVNRTIGPLVQIFDDKGGNGGGQMKSDELKPMTTIGQRTLFNKWIFPSDLSYCDRT